MKTCGLSGVATRVSVTMYGFPPALQGVSSSMTPPTVVWPDEGVAHANAAAAIASV